MNQAERAPLQRGGSLVRRLAATAALWAAGALLIGALALTALFRQTVLSDLDDRLGGVAELLLFSAEIGDDGSLAVLGEPTDPLYTQVFSGRYWQIRPVSNANPAEALRSRSLWDEQLALPPALLARARARPGEPVSGGATGPDDEPLRLLLRTVQLPGVAEPFVIAAAEDRRPADRRVQRFAMAAAGLFGLFAVTLAAGIVLQVRLGLGPVLRMVDSVADVRDGAAERLSGRYPQELYPLANELNALMDHSNEVVERARTHVGNLAHALKTPITVLSNEAREDDAALAEVVRRQTALMTEQVEHHLQRARAAARARAIGARTPVAPVVGDLARTLQRIYAARDISITADIDEKLVFRGERQDLTDMVGNLLDNACKWARASVRVSAAAGEAGRLIVTLDDDGPGLAEAERRHVLERGVRLDEKTPGSGLGLAIVNDLARAYGGGLSLDASPGGGLRAALDLPAARTILDTGR
ncbi:MAG: ATP-binding protein [Pseudomonadota bacterium]